MKIRETCFEQTYEFMQQELTGQGKCMPCGKTAFLLYEDGRTYEADYLKLKELRNEELFDALFLQFFNRNPDEQARSYWQEKIDTLEEKAFQEQFINALRGSQEYLQKGSKLKNFYTTAQKRPEIKIPFRARMKNRLYPIYLKLPEPLKAFAKKILKRRR